MSNLVNKIKNRNKSLSFVPFFVANFPSFNFLEEFLMKNKDKIDILELGIPFSDPVADGPILQEINYRSILNGGSFKKTLLWLENSKIPEYIDTILLLYFNLLQNDLENKLNKIKEIGVKGLVIPDLSFEEAKEFLPIFNKYNLDLVLFLSPTTREERKKEILKIAPSFVYCISVKGVTGEREELPEEGISFVKGIRKETDKPLVWGFGVKSKDQIESLKGIVDGVIVGSAFGKKLLLGEDIQEYFDELSMGTL
ncbi:MAG TPA: tryptophan synthase subunit alpha [Dictyoglomaceae bacterium]|nr:tryptophan synthase subunit alpha [Dictyoglomaceae bacterium]HOL39055.1 tryptophan synthase subunit alpha [Dictyoglomaceae bacterium]HOP94394.1 tryptophan synthase subunit alpha [Dictyoglomaceae bacterium]HPP15769.1 tryptophan synthase subunit alpha [Dictyoglomaceae bacterium]HPU42758.1 tryptophan synthase subunit alpha [Dictyoglomaceae bacterium]